MAYQVDKIVEMGGSGISVSTVKVESGETAFLMRHKPDVDAQPLIYAADVYINAKTRYDFPALVILAGLLIYREIRPTPKLTALIDIILRIACKELDKLIQSIVLHNPDKAMVCSQLVYQIYRDCGKTYELNLENGSLQVERNTPSVNGFVSLISLMNSSVNSDISEITPQDIPDEDHQMLGQKLYEAMLEQEEANEIYLGSNDVESLLPWVQKFAELLEEILENRSNRPDWPDWNCWSN